MCMRICACLRCVHSRDMGIGVSIGTGLRNGNGLGVCMGTEMGMGVTIRMASII